MILIKNYNKRNILKKKINIYKKTIDVTGKKKTFKQKLIYPQYQGLYSHINI